MLNLYRLCILLSVFVCLFIGCEKQQPVAKKNEYLFRIGDRTVSVLEFENAFEIAKSAYSPDIVTDPVLLKEIQVKTLMELMEKSILKQRAEELLITVSDTELDAVIKSLTQGYPPGEFEKELLESAVSYQHWKEQLRDRLLMEKVIAMEMAGKMSITDQDIQAYSKKLKRENKNSGNADLIVQEDALFKQICKDKAEEIYPVWMAELKKRYPITMNKTIWERIINSE